MNLKCLIRRRHKWKKEVIVPKLYWKLRECSDCKRIEVKIYSRWINCVGLVAMYVDAGLSVVLESARVN